VALLNKTASNPSPFRPGLTATVDIQTNHAKALTVPIQSVTTRQDTKAPTSSNPDKPDDNSDKSKAKIIAPAKEFVFVYSAGKVKQVAVTTGIQDDSYIQILSGLKGGEEVVSAPYTAISKALNDKMEVEKVDKSKLFSGDQGK
jgi:HlyD family secretion protein